MYIPLLSVARGHPPPHCENTQVLRKAITEDDDDDFTREVKNMYISTSLGEIKAIFNKKIEYPLYISWL